MIRVSHWRSQDKIAIVSGDGCKPEYLLQLKPDAFITGLLNQESIRIAEDLKITLIEATSYSTENEPLKLVAKNLQQKICTFNVDFEFIDIADSIASS